MKSKLVILILLVASPFNIFACTTFVIKTANELVFGRNLDWFSDNGIVVVNKRNIAKSSLVFPPEKSVQWTSKYGSITFNQFGKEFPFGGMNEKGLVVEVMVSRAEYPLFDNRPALNELQWVQYQLDNSSTIDEVINTDKLLRINKISKELHFLVCDSSGNVVVIEFIENKMVIHRGKDLPIQALENDTYSNSLDNYEKGKACRFVTVANMINGYEPENESSIIDYSFKILDQVALSGKWSIVYDIRNMRIHFKTSSNKNLREINFGLFDFDCNLGSLMYKLELNNQGSIDHLFGPFDSTINKEIFQDAIKSSNIVLSDEVLLKFYDYNNKYRCKK